MTSSDVPVISDTGSDQRDAGTAVANDAASIDDAGTAPTLTGFFVAGAAAGANAGTTLTGYLNWNSFITGTNGTIVLEGALR